jgi:glycosyltransferase involved in cell wall biosynthesis
VFGCFQDTDLYQRNRVLVGLMGELGGESYSVRPRRQSTNTGHHARLGSAAGLLQAFREQLIQFAGLWRQRSRLRDADVFFIPYPAYLDRWYLALLTAGRPRRPVILDAFLCLHDTVVRDRRMVAPGSLKARLLRALEGATLRAADAVLIDTAMQRQQLCDAYQLAPEAVHVIPVGIDEAQWQPLPMPRLEETLEVLFWGTFIPLHGVPVILEAARRLLELEVPVRIRLIGDGQAAAQCVSILAAGPLTNVSWDRRLVDTATLQRAVARAHCVLGVFGTSQKAASVIPYKACQALASNRPLISCDGPALRPLAAENNDIVAVPAGDPEALAAAIVQLRARLAAGAAVTTRAIYERHLSRAVIRDRLRAVLGGLRG